LEGALRVTVWNEYRHERENEEVAKIYPEGLHAALAKALSEGGFDVRTATLDEPEHGLSEPVLGSTDVLLWWGHVAHGEVSDEVVDRVHERVLGGMGLIVLHSGHFSKIFKKLMGTTCDLKWRHDDTERLWVVAPGHPIAEGIGEYIELEEPLLPQPGRAARRSERRPLGRPDARRPPRLRQHGAAGVERLAVSIRPAAFRRIR
jgi:trehalose utilization protein